MSKAQFQRLYSETDIQGDFWFKLLGWREPKLSIEFDFRSEDDPAEFERNWCRQVAGLSGLRVQARQTGGNILSGELPSEVVNSFAEVAIPSLILLPTDSGAAMARLRGTPVWSRRLTVHFPDGAFEERYRIFTGKAAFDAHAELLGHFLMQARLKQDVIIT